MEKIAVVRRNGLGDLLCAYPLILYLQKKWGASVTLFVDQRNAPLIPYLPPVEEVAIFPAKGFKYGNMLRMAWRYRKRFATAISAKTSPMKLMNFFLFCLGAEKRIAYVDQTWSKLFINHPLPYDPEIAKTQHQALKGLKIVEPALQEVPEEFYPKLHVPQVIRERYPVPKDLNRPVVLVSATTTRPASRFDPARYAPLLNRLHKLFPFSVLITGQKNDRVRAEAIAAGLHMEHHVHFPRNFDEFMILLDASDLFFVGDGGVAHIGAALGKRGVVLYGETNPVEWSPLSKRMKTFYHPEHVNYLNDEAIFQALNENINKVRDCGRDNL